MTKEQYEKYILLLSEVAPDQRWMTMLKSGYSPSNVIFMRKALEEENINPDFKPKPQPAKPKDERKISKLSSKLSKLFAERAQLSNRFHILTTVQARAKNSDKIEAVQNKMKVLYKQIDFFRATGKLITEYEDEYHLPNDKYELSQKIKSMRAAISRYKKEINGIEDLLCTDLPEDEIKALMAKLKHKKERLKTLMVQKTYAETKLEAL